MVRDSEQPVTRKKRPSRPGESLDYRNEFRRLYSASEKKVELVHAPRLNYLAITGTDEPYRSLEFAEAAEVLQRMALELRMGVSRAEVMEFAAMPLECVRDPEGKERGWTLMIMQPVLSPVMFEDVLGRQQAGAPERGVRLVRYYEGPAAQTLTRSTEPCCTAALERLGRFAAESGFAIRGPLHEILLDGWMLAAGGRARRILRLPVERVR